MANTLKSSRQGAVGFIGWLDVTWRNECSQEKEKERQHDIGSDDSDEPLESPAGIIGKNIVAMQAVRSRTKHMEITIGTVTKWQTSDE
jgi:hypothetical protein